MLFNSFDFLFFFPLVVIIYYSFPHRYRAPWLLLTSYYFYFYWEPSLVLLLLTSTVIDYYCGIKIHDSEEKKIRKAYLYLSIFINLGLLFFFKYLGFFAETTTYILEFFGIETNIAQSKQSYNLKQILLPVGISFYTFQTMSYSIDVYRKDIKTERNFVKYALYVSFFPQLVAGPIERAGRLIPQFYKKIQLNTELIKQGVIMMAWGFFLKIVVADRLSVYVDQAFSDPSKYKGLPLILGGYFFTFQIYYDFSAYTTIAIGAAKILGFDLMQNFNRPIFAKTMSEVWKRWHISLVEWLKDYVSKPLYDKKVKQYLIVLIIFFSIGLWHGANWTFVAWGVLNGIFLIFEGGTKKIRTRIIENIKIPIPRYIFEFLWWLFGFHFLVFTLIFFRSPSFDIVKEYLSNILLIKNYLINITSNKTELVLSIVLILIVQTIHYFKGNDKIYELITDRTPIVRWILYVIFILVIVLLSINRQNSFIYFQF